MHDEFEDLDSQYLIAKKLKDAKSSKNEQSVKAETERLRLITEKTNLSDEKRSNEQKILINESPETQESVETYIDGENEEDNGFIVVKCNKKERKYTDKSKINTETRLNDKIPFNRESRLISEKRQLINEKGVNNERRINNEKQINNERQFNDKRSFNNKNTAIYEQQIHNQRPLTKERQVDKEGLLNNVDKLNNERQFRDERQINSKQQLDAETSVTNVLTTMTLSEWKRQNKLPDEEKKQTEERKRQLIRVRLRNDIRERKCILRINKDKEMNPVDHDTSPSINETMEEKRFEEVTFNLHEDFPVFLMIYK